MIEIITFAHPGSLSLFLSRSLPREINRPFFLIAHFLSVSTRYRATFPLFIRRFYAARISRLCLIRSFASKVFRSFARADSTRLDSTRLAAARRGVEPKKVYRKMAARIYVIRGRRLFPSFLHLLYTATAAAAAATRRVVQRRGAGTTQLPRKLLHNKTACTFSYSRLCSPHPHLGDATIATDLRPPSLSFHLPFSHSVYSLPLSPNLSLSLSLSPSHPIFPCSSSPFAVREEKVLVRYTCAPAAGQIVKKGEKRRFPNAGRVGGSSGGENGVGFLRVFRLRRTVCEGG